MTYRNHAEEIEATRAEYEAEQAGFHEEMGLDEWPNGWWILTFGLVGLIFWGWVISAAISMIKGA